MVDCFSRYLIAVPVRNKYATTIAKALNRNLFSRWGLCRELLSDQGKEFDNKLLKALCDQYGVRKLRTSGYRPSANGRIERLHRSLNALLAKTVNEQHNDWDEVLDAAVAQYNGTVHRSTGFTPNRLMFGREAMTCLDLLDDQRPGVSEPVSPGLTAEQGRSGWTSTPHPAVAYVESLHKRLSTVFDLARNRSLRAALKRKTDYDRAVKERRFEVGQRILLREEACKSGLYDKWRMNYEGPYVILKRLGPVNFLIKRPNGGRPRVVHVDRIRRCLKETVRKRRHIVSKASISKQAGSDDFVNDPLRRSARLLRRRRTMK